LFDLGAPFVDREVVLSRGGPALDTGAANSAGSGIAARALGIVGGRQQRRSALSPSLPTDTPMVHSQTGATPLRY
ncbi:hypothetical protein, partial [Nocardia cerradoensis]|uniref:hypothetical protein n=1 Tax=Nocardia cerradoensis TaxID=85688 RepID=UPI001CB9CE94